MGSCQPRKGKLGAESETSRKKIGCRSVCPSSILSFMPGRPYESTLGNLLYLPGPHFPNSGKWRWHQAMPKMCFEEKLWNNATWRHFCFFILPMPVHHGWVPLDKPTHVKGRLGVMEQVLFLNGEAFHWELPSTDTQCYCQSTFLKNVSVPNEIIYLMSWWCRVLLCPFLR